MTRNTLQIMRDADATQNVQVSCAMKPWDEQHDQSKNELQNSSIVDSAPAGFPNISIAAQSAASEAIVYKTTQSQSLFVWFTVMVNGVGVGQVDMKLDTDGTLSGPFLDEAGKNYGLSFSVTDEAVQFVIPSSPAIIANFPGQYQILSNWCWLTCASGVINYYLGASAALPYTQCKLANQEIGLSCCKQKINGVETDLSSDVPLINAPGAKPLHYALPTCDCAGSCACCNCCGDPSQALNGTGKVTGTWGKSTTLAYVEGEIKNKHPVIGHITWDNNGGGHIIVFYGAYHSNGNDYYNVANPWTGNEVWVNGVVAGGQWDNCCETRKK